MAKRNKNKIKKPIQDIILNVCITVTCIIIGIVVFYPLWIVLISSISDPTYISSGEVWLLPKGINFEAYKTLLGEKALWIGYRNSLLYTIVGTTLQMLFTVPCAFALSKKTLPGRKFFILFFLFVLYFSGGLIPTYFVIKNLKLTNTPWALIIPGLVGLYNLIIGRNYFESSISEEIYDAAKLDGANMFQSFWYIAVPLAKPVLAVMVLNFALGHWNSYFDAMLYINDDSIQTLQVIIKRITTVATTGLEVGDGNVLLEDVIQQMRQTQLLKYAVVVVSALPMICLYPFIQKHFVKGIMLGSVKE